MNYADVAVAAGPGLPRLAGGGLPGVYTYHLPDGQHFEAGMLVEVPFGSRSLAGIVVDASSASPDFKTRPVTAPLSAEPLVSERGMALARFVATTYRAPLFECLCLVLPPGFTSRLPRALRNGRWVPPEHRGQPVEDAPAAAEARPPALTPDQREAYAALVQAAGAGRFEPFLLYGVTGSGKTLLYLEAIAEVVAGGRQAIVLVSEISLTPELVQRFRKRVPGETVVLHSGLSPSRHYRNWQMVAEGEARVVVGARSALFAPASELGLIVLDEEHDSAYKQEASPRYHARDVALELGRLACAPVVLSSATPDIGTWWRAQRGELKLLRLAGRYRAAKPSSTCDGDSARLPPVEVVDLRRELKAGNVSIFSRVLRRELEATLERGEQAILFINRRGTATCVICRECGFVVTCRRCEAPLVYHRAGEALICHRCNRRRPALQRCPDCGGYAIRHLGVGTQRVEQELATLLPSARAVRWDRDAGRTAIAHGELWERFRAHEADVLIGTQMVAKALDFPLVTLVGVILADVGLYLPDFRAPERSFQLLTQVAGRAGRGPEGGRVIVQTYSPDHYAIRHSAAHDYQGFYGREAQFRAEHGYPPLGRLVRVVFSDTNEQRCWRETGRLRRSLQERMRELDDPELRLIGPAPCYFQRIRGRYRWQLVVRGERFDELFAGLALPANWMIDVDPVNLL